MGFYVYSHMQWVCTEQVQGYKRKRIWLKFVLLGTSRKVGSQFANYHLEIIQSSVATQISQSLQ